MPRPDGGNNDHNHYHDNHPMNGYVPKNFVKITDLQWQTFLQTVNWTRDGFANGRMYENAATGKRIAFESNDGEVWVDPYFSRIPENTELCHPL